MPILLVQMYNSDYKYSIAFFTEVEMTPVNQYMCNGSLLDTLLSKAARLGAVQQIQKSGGATEEQLDVIEKDISSLRAEAERRMAPGRGQ